MMGLGNSYYALGDFKNSEIASARLLKPTPKTARP